jgi:hypothetical protein
METLPPVKLIGFVGRQDLLDAAAVAQIIGERLKALAAGGERLLAGASLTGAADLLFAKEALRLKLPLWLLLPIEAEELVKSLPESMRRDAAEVIAQAVQVAVLEVDPGPERTLMLGWRLVDRSDLLLVLTRKDAVRRRARGIARPGGDARTVRAAGNGAAAVR